MNMRSARRASFWAISALVGLSLSSSVRADLTEAPAVPDEVLVGYDPSPAGSLQAGAAVTEVGNVAGYDNDLHAARVKLRPGVSLDSAISHLLNQPGVVYAEPNFVLQICAVPNDPAFTSLQYAPRITQANKAWDVWKPRGKVVIAVVDTGVQSTHPELKAVMQRDVGGKVIGWNTLTNTSNAEDDGGHGTHCAGVALAHINDGVGSAGITGWNPAIAGSDTFVKLMPIKALNSSGKGTAASIAAGIAWAANHGARVISISAATTSPSTTLQSAVAYAWSKGCVIVAAAGNGAISDLTYPAAYPNVLSVAATDETDTLLFFSQYGSWVKCAAPGSNVYSTFYHSSYTGMSGTSTAAPHVAAEAAALLSQNTTLSNAQVNTLITSEVDPFVPYQGRDLGAGAGRINIYRAMLAAGNGQPTLTTVSLNPSVIPNATSAVGTVYLGARAPSGGIIVKLASSNTSVATMPASVTVPAGTNSATFVVTGKLVASTSKTTVKASADGVSVSTVLQVNGSVPTSLVISPSTVASKSTFVGTVTLDAPAPSGGSVVALSDNGGSIVSTPLTVTVPAGARSVSFKGSTGAVSWRTSVTVNASKDGVTVSFTIIVNPPA